MQRWNLSVGFLFPKSQTSEGKSLVMYVYGREGKSLVMCVYGREGILTSWSSIMVYANDV